MEMWTVVQYVGTPLTLLAFIAAVFAWSYSVKLKEKAELLKTLPESERVVYLEKELESYQIDAVQKGVTGQQKFELMQLVILQRAHRLKIVAMTAIAIAVVLAVTIIMVWVSGDSITVNKGVAAKGNHISIQNEVHSNE